MVMELFICSDGDEGLFCVYDNVEFLVFVWVGDYIEVCGQIVVKGCFSWFMIFEVWKVIVLMEDGFYFLLVDLLDLLVLVCKVSGICVVFIEC